ncbi:MAG: hypothetical protein ACTHU0_12145 [Kofleriaceae bacterium]
MRSTIAILVGALSLMACGKGENAGAEEVRKQAEAEQKAKEGRGEAAKVIRPPVPGQAKIPCSQLIDPAPFQAALGEVEPLTVKDVTAGDGDSTASCALIRGGKRPSEAEQRALLKKEARLGVLPGDETCNVSAYCYTIEDPERFKQKCKDRNNEEMGTFACVQVVAQGIDDVFVYRFLDEDTKCVLKVRGGPSQVNNELIRKCAITARDTIGPAQIAVDPNAAAPAAAGSGS